MTEALIYKGKRLTIRVTVDEPTTLYQPEIRTLQEIADGEWECCDMTLGHSGSCWFESGTEDD